MVKHDAGLRVGYWRSVSHVLNAFANEGFIDELAVAAKARTRSAYRMSLLGKQPRFQNVLKLAAEKAGWGKPPPAGRSRGVAMMEGYDTYMAQVAEISMKDGEPVVHRVVTACRPRPHGQPRHGRGADRVEHHLRPEGGAVR